MPQPFKRRVPVSWSTGGYRPPLREAEMPTAFDRMVATLNLKESDWHRSAQLTAWVHRNCDFRYIPESLLKKLGITVNDMATTKDS